jgi:2-(1,2-epoxy-1,2-dihydrophenyl)acetyl-CoA isomerase
MSLNDLLLEKENGITTLTLNRPDKYNALTNEMVKELRRIFEEMHRDDSTKVLILTGAGRAFCSGADVVRRLAAGGEAEKTRWELISPMGSNLLALAKMPKPTIAAINGVVAGVGNSLALACDIRIASEQARFTTAWVKVGFIPDGGATYFLPRILGMSKALELMFTGDMIDAAEAERIGLVSRVVPHNDLMTAVKELATRIAKGPSVAIELMKKGAYRSLDHDLESQLDFESFAQEICRNTKDHKEGVEAFMQKREPKFEGR